MPEPLPRPSALPRLLVAFAALNGAVAVAAGAFAAHGAGPQVKGLLQTGAQYQMVHALLALACALLGARLAGWLAAAGGLVFATALYLMALAGWLALGAVAPVGGALMIVSWLLLGWVALTRAGEPG